MNRVYFGFPGRIRAGSLSHCSVRTCLQSRSLETVIYQRFWMSGRQPAGEWGADAAGGETALGTRSRVCGPAVAEPQFPALIYIWISAAGLTDDS